VVTFSGDKLCGGPQAGLVVGTQAAIARLAAHPLARALRIDKCTAAALEATLRLHRDGRTDAIPALRALLEPESQVAERAQALATQLGKLGVASQTVASVARVGGGSLPTRELPSRAVALRSGTPDALAKALRAGSPAVVGRVQDQTVLLDLRAVADLELGPLAQAAAAALRIVSTSTTAFTTASKGGADA